MKQVDRNPIGFKQWVVHIVANTAIVTLNEGEHEAQVNPDIWEYTINY